ncbi:unnamed protein product [Notodromas monacha]|uniref:Sidoreflexin n=1 Tax=Notodromas monacha TaxID=399045 RepID=A0A7R9GA01_9CRUS|nr:unnamed protein product [Notodromas monacha]CAG0914798.1 unnamed protein product [Notodromas monacha]
MEGNDDGSRLVSDVPKINIDKPRWDQTHYWGRARHFFTVTNPLNILKTSGELEEARQIVKSYKAGKEIPGLTVDQLWNAKQTYDSAFHPDTGEKQIIVGRMSAQVPMNMIITGGMLTWYKNPSTVIFWQWTNQSFNALVNYTNRSGASPITMQQLGLSYALATTAAMTTALGLNRTVKMFSPLIGRFVPFAAVAAANAFNIPLMRQKEIFSGIPVLDQDDNPIGESTVAAQEGIRNVVISRIFMAAPSMMGIPVVMNHLEKKGVLKRYPWANAPLQIVLCGVVLVFATPLCCALFPQMSSIAVTRLEQELQVPAWLLITSSF